MAGLRSDEILIREARPRDRDSVLGFTRNTFHWGDYLPRTWDDWLHAPNGKLLIAEVNGRVVGNLHVAFAGQREAWFEGMRVHPRFRHRGVAGHLDSRARELASAAGCHLVRLETASDNLPAQAALARFGYRRVLSLREWEAPGVGGPGKNVRPARARDLEHLVSLWENSWMRQATRSLAPLGNPWHWGKFTASRLREAVKQGRIWATPAQGRVLGFADVNEEQDAFEVMLLVGRGREVGDMLSTFRMLGAERGLQKCYLVLPDTPRAEAWARANGFRDEEGGMLIYARLI